MGCIKYTFYLLTYLINQPIIYVIKKHTDQYKFDDDDDDNNNAVQ